MFFALANPSETMSEKNALPMIGGAFRQTDKYISGQTFKFDYIDMATIDLKHLRHALFQLEPKLSNDYDTWTH